jgi:zinc/manganese transport system substrate-binding protein
MTSRALTVSSVPLVGALVLSGCASASPEEERSPQIVVTTSVIGSVVGQVADCVAGGEGESGGQVRVLLPIGTDPHDFQPSSEQVATMVSADVVIANGLLLEEGLEAVLDEIEADGGAVWRVAEWIDPLAFSGDHSEDEHAEEEGHADEEGHDDEGHEEGADHGHGDEDPHFWLDMSRMAAVAEEVGARLSVDHGEDWTRCGQEVASDILDTEQEVFAEFETMTPDRRVIVTDHDAFSYLADRYDFDIAGVVIPGGSTLAEPTSQDLARLIETIRERNIGVLIGSVFRSSPLLDALAEESGGDLRVVELYVESVGEPGSDQASYQQMMAFNARALAEALQD